jgi:hypothetical protein
MYAMTETKQIASFPPSYASTQPPSYARPPSYASAAASGRGLFAAHTDMRSAAGTVAFRASGRCDPASRQLHLMALADAGKCSSAQSKGGPHAKNLYGSGCMASPASTWEAEIMQHAQRKPLGPAPGVLEHGGHYDGILGSGAAGAAHPHLGLFGASAWQGGGMGMGMGPPPPTSPHYPMLSAAMSEEGKRQLLLTNERARRGAEQRWAPTNTLGAYVNVAPPPPQMAPSPRLANSVGVPSLPHAYAVAAPPTADPASRLGGAYGGAPPTSYVTPAQLRSAETPNAPNRRVQWANM